MSDLFCCLPWGKPEEWLILLSFLRSDSFCCLSWREPGGICRLFLGEPEALFFKLWLTLQVKDPIYLRHSLIQCWISISQGYFMLNTIILLFKFFSINSLCKYLDPQGMNPIDHGGLPLCILEYTYFNDESSNLQLHFQILFKRVFFLLNFLFSDPLLAPPYRGSIKFV